MTDGLSKLTFNDAEGGGLWLKFKADTPVKLRIWSTNPVVHNTSFTDPQTDEVSVSTKYAFAVWNITENREQIMDAGVTITKNIGALHNDEDYGKDITKVDIKIAPTGEKLERRYVINVLPKPVTLTQDQKDKLDELDKKLDDLVKEGVRADDYNSGITVPTTVKTEEVQIEDIEGLNEVFGDE